MELVELMRESRSIVGFTGAGVSTESGIPDSVETPAPVNPTIDRDSRISSTSSDRPMTRGSHTRPAAAGAPGAAVDDGTSAAVSPHALPTGSSPQARVSERR